MKDRTKNVERYRAIPPSALIPGTMPDFQIYILSSEGRYILWALEGNKVSPERLARLYEGGHDEVFINIDDEFKYEQHLEANLGTILDSDYASDSDKASIFTMVSTNIVKSAVETSLGLGKMNRDMVLRTQNMVESAMAFMTESRSLKPLVKMIGHDYQTYEHATKVLWFTVAFLRLNPDILEQVESSIVDDINVLKQCGVGALLHDIGKTLVSQDILNKEGGLSPVEWEIVKRHPLNSLAMLVDADIPIFVKKGILHHHEDFSGGGYPMGLASFNIPILARIFRIIDVFDAMTSRRPYKDPIPPMKALQIMIKKNETRKDSEGSNLSDRDSGMMTCFDEALLKRFISFLGSVNF